MKTKTCLHCKKRLSLFEFYPSQNIKNGYRGECKKCSNLYNRQKYRDIKKRKQQEAIKKCKFCGKIVKNDKFNFCSNSCAQKHRLQDRTKNNNWQNKRIIIECPICGKKVEKQSYLLKTTKNFFCSCKCQAIWKCKHQKRKDTDIERKMKEILIKKNLKFKEQVVFAKICIADFYLPKYKLAIFCDGEYWHDYPNGKKRDKKQIEELKEIGINAIRLWSRQILKEDPSKYLKQFLTHKKNG